MTDKESFKKEFKALLEKYDVTIGFQVSECSDTYGLHGEKIVVYHGNEDWIEVDGWNIDKTDI